MISVPSSVGVIGFGLMAQAILKPLIKRGDLLPENVFGVVGKEGSVKEIATEFPKGLQIVAAGNSISSEVWNKPIKLLAVKPQQLNDVEESLEDLPLTKGSTRPLLISILAGVNLNRLQKKFPGHCCVRAVPNTPSLVGEGLTALSWGKDVSIDQRIAVQKLFEPISEVLDLPEDLLDPFLALTSSGPAYIALIAESLADGAVAAGLPRSLASYLAHRTLAGTATLLRDKDLHPAQLKDMVASPGGTTITAIRHLEMAGIRSALIEAVVLATERSREFA